MAIQDDFRIYANGDIRYTGTTANYTVIAFHRWLQDLQDDAQAAGNDLTDITDQTSSERSTDNIITLINGFNIDDVAAQHLYDGSIIQASLATIYDGILVFAPAGTYLNVMQNGAPIAPNFWTTGLNADSAAGISHRFMVKVRSGGVDIDGRRLLGVTREFGSTYSEFPINGTARGNNVIALATATDLNNATAAATVKGWTTITNTEGYRLLDVNNDTTNEPYYSEWNRATFTINQLWERTKWLSRRATAEDSNADTGSSFTTGNATINGQGQAFSNGVVASRLTRAQFRLRTVGAPTGSLSYQVFALTGTLGSTATPTGSALATSGTIDVTTLTSAYQTIELGFATPALLAASTNYFVVVSYTAGGVSDYVEIDGQTTGTHAGNRAELTGAWAASAGTDLWFSAFTSADLYGIPGERFRGPTHQVALVSPTGTFSAVEAVSWGSGATAGTGQMLAIDSVTAGTKMWIQLLTGVAPSASVVITGGTSGATATNSGAPTDRSVSQPFAGASTGSAIIGAYGVGVETADLVATDKLTDLDGTLRVPPNNVTFTVLGLESGEDRVLVGPESGGLLQLNQLTLNTDLTGGAETAVVCTASIPTDTPATGTIRILLDSGIYRRVPYTAFTGSTFTIAEDFSGANEATGAANIFISYIDKLAGAASEGFTVVYLADRGLFIRARDGGTAGDNTATKTFETTSTLGSAGGSSTVIRTSDE